MDSNFFFWITQFYHGILFYHMDLIGQLNSNSLLNMWIYSPKEATLVPISLVGPIINHKFIDSTILKYRVIKTQYINMHLLENTYYIHICKELGCEVDSTSNKCLNYVPWWPKLLNISNQISWKIFLNCEDIYILKNLCS